MHINILKIVHQYEFWSFKCCCVAVKFYTSETIYVFCIWIHHLHLHISTITQITEKNNSLEYIRNFVPFSNREILKETLAADEEYHRDKWTLFGNEAEKVEIDVIRNQHLLRTRVDKLALRKQVKVKFWSQQ